MTDWSKKISSATIERRDYGMGVVIGYWSGIVTSGSVEEAAEKHGWPLVIEPFDKNRMFREISRLESKVKEMQKAFATIHGIASETFESCNQLELIRLTAVEHLKGDSQ